MKIKIVAIYGAVIVSLLIVLCCLNLKMKNISSNIVSLRITGRAIARGLLILDSFPSDTSIEKSKTANKFLWQSADTSNIQHLVKQFSQVSWVSKKFCNTSYWTVIKNLPEEPPSNLIIVATRNVDAESLRTKIDAEDMHKHLQFNFNKNELCVLRGMAFLIRADGQLISIRITSKQTKYTTYANIYGDQTFDLTTNFVNGLQVKYLTPEGEVIPTND